MKLSWLFNGTMQAHHLAGAYLTVWLIQGGYAGWIALRLLKTSRDGRAGTTVERSRQ